ncbi:MAG: alpha-L-rhamnosidase [Clostridia bacterium]|nr:alpha-L-rhamnosidase [Clostridia bacterium]
MKVLDQLSGIKPFDTDPRTRTYLRPVCIVMTKGDVQNAECLLKNVPNQIQLADSVETVTMRNTEGSEHAAILLDLGCEIHGSVRILTQNCDPHPAQVKIRMGESVSEAMNDVGVKGATTDHANRDFMLNLQILSGTDTNESGFRFIWLELLGDKALLNLRAVTGVLIVRDIEYVGSFESDDPLVDQIYRTAAYTAHLNMQEYLWDGIKRDRLVWIGDMHPEVMTICSVFGDNEVVPRSLDFARDVSDLNKETRFKWMNGIPSYSLWWLMCQYDYYMQNGNLDYLAEQKDYLVRLLELLCGQVDEDGVEKMEAWRFLDWPTNADPEAKHAGLQGLLCMGLDAGAKLADVLGESASAERCRQLTAKMKEHHFTCQAKQAVALTVLAGINDAVETDRDYISKGGAHGYSTFYSYYTLAARAMAGKTAEALQDMREYYGAMLKLGATTFWEDFSLDWVESAGGFDHVSGIDEIPAEGKKDIHGDYGAYCYVGLRHSLCHGWSSGPVTFLTRHVLGVKILEPGCKKLEIKPNLCGLGFIRGSFPTPYGKVSIYADKNGVKIDAPDGVEIVR